jgi:hypothetical protein
MSSEKAISEGEAAEAE